MLIATTAQQKAAEPSSTPTCWFGEANDLVGAQASVASDNFYICVTKGSCASACGNITNENVNVKHYMQLTWVSRPIPEDRPPEQELFGEFYNTETP